MANSKTARQIYSDFLYRVYKNGYYLSDRQFRFLRSESDKLKDTDTYKAESHIPNVSGGDEIKVVFRPPADVNEDNVDVIYEEHPDDTSLNVVSDEKYKRSSFLRKGSKIDKSDWMPKDLLRHDSDFVNWIDSINTFPSIEMKNFTRFNLYCQQAEEWFNHKKDIMDFDTTEDRCEYIMQEYNRCFDNTLYFALKYAYLQESALADGKRKYTAGSDYVHHKIILYLLDCGYSFMLGKPRQIGSTSVLGIAADKFTLFKKNHYLKFITQDKITGEEIFEDKIKFPYSCLPDWMKYPVLNDRDNLFKIGKKIKTGSDKGINSKIEVVAPSRTAINGGSPSVVFIDEIGSIDILTEMMNEGRPTLMWKNPDTGKLEMKRQVVLWGTGTTAKGGGAYQSEWLRLRDLWNKKEYEASGIIPIFLDWTTRCDQDEYNSQKKYYYGSRASTENMTKETSRVQFHQHYPTTDDDMFITTEQLLVSKDFLNDNLKRIKKAFSDGKANVQYGYFDPVFDKTSPMGEGVDVPYKIVGAEWCPVDDIDDRATAAILIHPPKGERWKRRFFAGTDPIASDTGTSKMATVIWDNRFHTVVAVVNHREQHNPKYNFLQSMLCKMYYDTERSNGVMELVERNIGKSYFDYQEERNKDVYNTFVINSELPVSLQSGKAHVPGIDNHGGMNSRTKFIIHKLQEVLDRFGDRQYMEIIFHQLKTFVCKITRSGNDKWESLDKRYYFDDVLFALTYAYIAASCDATWAREPVNIDSEEVNVKTRYELNYDSNWQLVRERVTVEE